MKAFRNIIFFAALFFSFQAMAQLSPGPLTEAHKHLEGINNCTQCHDVGNKIPNAKCLNCHKEIAELRALKKGYHSSAEVEKSDCVKCHGEHLGRNFELTRFNQKTFNHDLTGYKLEEKHASADCRKCHLSKNIENVDLQKRDSTFLGLNDKCQSCHEDYHQKTLTENCQSCHTNFQSFRPAKGFNHNNAEYKLEGAHVNVDCKKCHKPTQKNGKEFQQFKGVSFSSCTSCHTDVHKGKFGVDCLKCHTNTSFTQVKTASDFNHNLTSFALVGKHQKVDCKKCHTKNYISPVKHNRCDDCHSDYHKGDFVKANQKPDCKQCHSIDQPFTNTLYTIDDHNKSKFVLTGSHLASPCFLCHKPNEKWNFKNMGSKCSDCHKSSHAEVMSPKFLSPETCENCHNTEVWNRITFDHNNTDWPLKGKHTEASCRQCHYREDQQGTPIVQIFEHLSSECTSCHKSIHGQEFQTADSSSCTQCHSDERAWNKIVFNHNTTKFVLDGAHENISCTKCHKYQSSTPNNKNLQFKMEGYKCIDCHY